MVTDMSEIPLSDISPSLSHLSIRTCCTIKSYTSVKQVRFDWQQLILGYWYSKDQNFRINWLTPELLYHNVLEKSRI